NRIARPPAAAPDRGAPGGERHQQASTPPAPATPAPAPPASTLPASTMPAPAPPASALPAYAQPASALPAPAQPASLLADLVDFTGRAPQVAELTRLLTQPAQRPGAVVIAAVTGSGGLGKTSLAIHVAHQCRESFPDGQLYLQLRGDTQQ